MTFCEKKVKEIARFCFSFYFLFLLGFSSIKKYFLARLLAITVLKEHISSG